MCSTPRGITGKIANRQVGLLILIGLCSTPRGITGKIACLTSDCVPTHGSCAQRLAASQEKSLTRLVRATDLRPSVLNASRHHRKNRTDFTVPDCSTTCRVLNASRHHRKNRNRPLAHSRCLPKSAQRLAASQEKSLEQCLMSYLRHRLCSTPRGITGKIAKLGSGESTYPGQCSTPRGITGKIAALY